MGRPRKTLSEIDERSKRKHSGRYAGRTEGARPQGELGPPSKTLTALQKRAWLEMVKSAPVALGESDRSALEVCAVIRAKVLAGTARSSEMALLISTQRLLGLIATNRKPREEDEGGGVAALLREYENDQKRNR